MKKIVSMVLIAAITATISVAVTPNVDKVLAAPISQDYVLMYADEFNGATVNESDWYYRDSDTIHLGGYSQKENVSVETADGIGYLKIDYNKWDVNSDDVADPIGGGTISKRTFGYGYYETKMKFYNNVQGFHQSFWTCGAGYYSSYSNEYKYNNDAVSEIVPWVNSAIEIDVIELDSAYNYGSANYHWHQPSFSTPTGAHKGYSSNYMNLNNWITVAFEWQPGVVIYYIDGVERHRVTYDINDTRYAPQEVWITGLANTNWGSGTPEAGANMKVDYFRYYAKRTPNVNIVGNAGFDSKNASAEIPPCWIENDGIPGNAQNDESKVVAGTDAYDGVAYLKHENITNPYNITTKQRLDFIPNSTYKLTAWVKSSGGQTEASMKAQNFGGTDLSINIPATSTWTQITIDNINVTNNRMDIGFTSNAQVGQWIQVDKVKLIDTVPLPTPIPTPEDALIVIDNGVTGYAEVGTWNNSSLIGYNDTSTRYAGTAIGPSVQWTPNIKMAGVYDIYIYKVVSSNTDPNAKIDIKHNGGTDTKYIDYTVGTSGWVYL